jgi:hypothetical protein
MPGVFSLWIMGPKIVGDAWGEDAGGWASRGLSVYTEPEPLVHSPLSNQRRPSALWISAGAERMGGADVGNGMEQKMEKRQVP